MGSSGLLEARASFEIVVCGECSKREREWTMQELESYLAGRWRRGDSSGAVRLFDPSTEEPVAVTSTSGFDLAEAVLWAREHGGPALRAMTFAERGRMLTALSKALRAVREELLEASACNNGATRSDAKFDVDGAIGTLAHYGALGERLGARRSLPDGEGEALGRSARFWGRHLWQSRRGVAVHVNAFNFPAWGLGEKLAVALLAGVPVITKPATATALTAWIAARHLLESGAMPQGAFQFLCGGAGDLLDHLGSQDVLAFTGSSDTAARIRGHEAFLRRGARLNVEADSLNATVLLPGEEPEGEVWHRLVRDIVREVTQKAGQKCTATRRVLVPREHLAALEETLREAFEAVPYGDPRREDVRMGPLATARQRDDVLQGIARLQEGGARRVTRDPAEVEPIGVPSGKGFFVRPTLLVAEAPERCEAVHRFEVFGPVTTLLPYEGFEQAIAWIRRGEGSLVTSVYGDDRELLRTAVEELGPWTGRLSLVSGKVVDQATPPGWVLPGCVHGGPGRAGGGEELGGERGLFFYMQRTALQGDRALLKRFVED